MTVVRARGFTLLELMVALAIFGLLSVMAYGGLKSVLDARDGTARSSARLGRLESAVLMLNRDLLQALDRGVRDEFGDPVPALRGGEGAPLALELTRAGWSNPANAARSGLQRVAYGLEQERLVRYAWQTLDRAQGAEPYAAPLLDGVREFRVRFLTIDREWVDSWPPAQTQNAPPLPLAVGVTLELADWGSITRLVRLPGGGA